MEKICYSNHKLLTNVQEGLADKLKEFSLPNLKWIERLDLTNDPALDIDAVANGDNSQLQSNDFNRELLL